MFTYVISDLLDYSLLICDDAGPGFASSMNWNGVKLKDLNYSTEVLIIDPRLQQAELEKFEHLIIENPRKIIFFRIADPYTEIYSDNFYYRFLEKIAKYSNVYLLSTYQPKELVLTIKNHYTNRFLHLPYPYIIEKELNKTTPRKQKIILSGSINQKIYPYRTKIWQKLTRSILSFFYFSILKHPGYLDMQPEAKHQHQLIKSKFISYLSNFRYMLLCPSRAGLEFLKYNECAYAGCIPVGLPPDSYPDEIKKLFLTLRSEKLIKDTLHIIFGEPNKETVQLLRTFLREARHPDTLNLTLKNFIVEYTVHTS